MASLYNHQQAYGNGTTAPSTATNNHNGSTSASTANTAVGLPLGGSGVGGPSGGGMDGNHAAGGGGGGGAQPTSSPVTPRHPLGTLAAQHHQHHHRLYHEYPPDAAIAPLFSGIHIGEPGSSDPSMRYMSRLDMGIKVDPDAGSHIPATGLGSTPAMAQHYMDPMAASGLNPQGGRSRKNKEGKICGVCGDHALGYNFDAISCESCKAFFRRNAPKGLDFFRCPYEEKCKLDVPNRRFCKRCRLSKCFQIGMRKEYILTEEEKARKRAKIEENKLKAEQTKKTPVVSASRSPDTSSMQSNNSNEWGFSPPCDASPNSTMMGSSPATVQIPCPGGVEITLPVTRELCEEDQILIEELRRAYNSSLEISLAVEPSRKNVTDVGQLANIAEISVRRVIDMAKKVSAFKALPQMDQICLLKGGSIELLILRSVITFDREKQHFLDPSDREETSALNIADFTKVEGGLFNDHMKFVKSAIEIGADQTSLILLLIISLFSPDRPNLQSKDQVEWEQEKYSQLLFKYLCTVYPLEQARKLFPRLLMKLTDIRNLNEEHSQVLLKVNPAGLQPLMQEVLELHPEQVKGPSPQS